MNRFRNAALTGGLFLLIAGCTASATTPEDETQREASTSPVRVVASMNVWGDIAAQIGGEAVNVTSIIDDPNQDPHEFEASARVALDLAEAQLVIKNGGGFDDFADQLLAAHESEATVLDAVDASGLTPAPGDELNEHIWYDLPTVVTVAEQIASELGTIVPEHSDEFDSHLTEFKDAVDGLTTDATRLRGAHDGASIGVTEPLPLYLTELIGLENRTPEEFTEAMEEGEDVSPSVLQKTLSLFEDREVDVLVYNEQTEGSVSERVRAAAESAGIPVVSVTETIPAGEDYLSWMASNIDALGTALEEASTR